jgi:osmoprotectant transport system ATP-binding protein
MNCLPGEPEPEIVPRTLPRQLSGGQERIGVARAMAANPPIMLMDQPFGAIDPSTARSCRTSSSTFMPNCGKPSSS